MSCSSCGCNPCNEVACDASNEPLASALNNFITSFYGSLTKTCVNDQVVWVLPCDLDNGIAGYPRVAGEGIACYFLRVFNGITASALILVDGSDTTPGFLGDKVVAGGGVTITILNPGGNEQLEIDTVAGAPGRVGVSAADSTFDFLNPKINVGPGLAKTIQNPGANEVLLIGNAASVSIAASNINWALSNCFFKTLGANTTFTFTNDSDAQTIIVAITNTAGNFTATWPVAVQWSNGLEPVLTIGAKTDVFTFVKINGVIYGSVVQSMT